MLKYIIGEQKKQTEEQPLQKIYPDISEEHDIIPTTINTDTVEYVTLSQPMLKGKNIIGSDVEVKGSIRFSDDLIMNGRIDGEVISYGTFTVGESGLVKGDIKTKSLTIFGKVEGDINVQESCSLRSDAVVEGDITAGYLSIDEGATFMGQSRVGKNADSKPSVRTKVGKQ